MPVSGTGFSWFDSSQLDSAWYHLKLPIRGVAYWNGTCFGNKNKEGSIPFTATSQMQLRLHLENEKS